MTAAIAELEGALRALGVHCAVEARERLAVLVPRGDARLLADPRTRRSVESLVRAHGFTHAALELTDDAGGGAALSGD